MKRYFINRLLIRSVVVLLISGANACGDKEDDLIRQVKLVNTRQTKELNFIGHWKNEGKRECLVKDFAREYEFLNQDVLINLKFPEEIGYNRYDPESTLNFTANILSQPKPEWDIIVLNTTNELVANQLGDPEWAKKYLVDFSELPEFKRNTISDIDLEKQKQRWGGIITGPFIEGQYWALWTNTKVAEKLGIKVKQYGMTYEDFLSYIKAVHRYNNENSDEIVALQEASDFKTAFNIAIQLYLSILNDKDAIYEKEASIKKLMAWEKTLNALESMAVYKPINNDWKHISWGDTKNNLLHEECLFFTNGSWMYNIWLQEDKDKVKNCMPTEYPFIGTPAPIYPSNYISPWAVLKNSPNKEQAIRFLLAMNKPSMAELWVRNTKCPTGIKGSVAGIGFGKDKFENFASYIQNTYGSNTYQMDENSSFIFGLENRSEPNYFMEVFTGELSATEAMDKIHGKLNL